MSQATALGIDENDGLLSKILEDLTEELSEAEEIAEEAAENIDMAEQSGMAGASSEAAGNASLELGGSTVPMENVSQTDISADIAITAQGASIDCRA